MKYLAQVLRKTFIAIVLVGAFCVPASAQTDPRWACWYDSADLIVRCLLTHAAETGDEMRRNEVDRHFDHRLPELVRMIWGSPEQLAGARVNIPLHTVPYDMTFVHQLAASVMCGTRKDCSVGFDTNADGRAELRAAAIESGASEEEVMAEVEAQGFHVAAYTPVEEEPVTPRRRKALSRG